MPKGKPVHPVGYLHDEHVAVGFPLSEYLKAMGIKQRDAATTFHTPAGRVSQWIMQKRMPYSVFEYMMDHWGISGFNMPKKEKASKRYKVHPMFGKYVGAASTAKAPEPPPPEPPPPPAPAQPATVPWDVYQATVQMLVEHSSRLMLEKQIIDSENRRLQVLNDKLMAEQGMGTALQRLDAAFPIPPPANGAVPTQQVTAAVRQAVAAAPPAIQRVVGDLENRLPKALGSLH